jgi:hypothetical protein
MLFEYEGGEIMGQKARISWNVSFKSWNAEIYLFVCNKGKFFLIWYKLLLEIVLFKTSRPVVAEVSLLMVVYSVIL